MRAWSAYGIYGVKIGRAHFVWRPKGRWTFGFGTPGDFSRKLNFGPLQFSWTEKGAR